MTGLLLLTILGLASAEFLGHHGDFHTVNNPPTHEPFTFNIFGETNTEQYLVNGIVVCDYRALVLRDGEVAITGPQLELGQTAPFEVLDDSFATTEDGERVVINSGLVHAKSLSIEDTQAIQKVLSLIGISESQFSQYTGTTLPEQGILELTSGVLNVDGVDKSIRAGLLIIVSVLVEDDFGLGYPSEPEPSYPSEPQYHEPEPSFHGNTEPSYGGNAGSGDVTILVTEVMAHETVTVTQPAYITKTNTEDFYITITSPYYASDHVTHTQIDWLTETVADAVVIRSTLPAEVFVVTSTDSTGVVLTVTNTETQFHVQTRVNTLTSTLQHTEKQFSYRTVTVLNVDTSTVVKTITQTGVTTTYVTSTVDNTVYLTSTMVMTITAEPQSTTQVG